MQKPLQFKKYKILFKIAVHEKYLLPRITQHPKSQVVAQGSPVELSCDYDTIDIGTVSSTLASSSFIELKWLHNQQPISHRFSPEMRIDKNRLIISAFEAAKHAGEYRCLLNNTYISWAILSEPANISLACKHFLK